VLLPFAILPWLYKLTSAINQGLDRWILDAPLERLEGSLFGGQPSLLLAERAPWPLLSEALHACYWAYLPLVPLLAVVLAAQRREREAEHTAGTICSAIFLCYLFYIWLPVRSPLYNYPPLPPPLSDGFFYHLTHAFAARGGVEGGAFPSSHAAIATLAWLLAVRHERRVAWITALPTAGLLVATVYGRYHYALDTIAGVALGVLVFTLDPVERLGNRRRRPAGRGGA
jgi:membrane-associated phospholipid phosphatase